MPSDRAALPALFILLVVPLLSCNVVTNLFQEDGATATPPLSQVTVTATSISTAPVTARPTDPPSPDPPSTPVASATSTATPAGETGAAPRIIVAQDGGRLIQSDLQGQTTPFAVLPTEGDASRQAIVRAMAFGETVYLHLGFLDPRFVEVGPAGMRTLDFIDAPAGDVTSFAVWPGADGQPGRVAWTGAISLERVWMRSSRLDGSEEELLLEARYDEQANTDAVWQALHYSEDGNTLYFSRQPAGIGGVILFGGYSSLWAYDVPTGEVQPIQPQSPCGSPLALEPLSPSGEWVPDQCGEQLHLSNVQTGARLDVGPPAEVGEMGQFGGVVYSPDGRRYAYGIENGVSSGAFTDDPQVVQGWVAVAELGSNTSQTVVTSPAGSYFVVKAWLPGDVLVLQQDDRLAPGRSIWTVNVDGSMLQKVADGQFVAVLR